tara:strand:+ start:4033 stop:5481 length:1449 start_codon:yes stop_codon:yes gene_type:complete
MSSKLGMNKISFYIILGLILHLISAYFTYGFYSDDEHFQILEPAAYLLGLNDVIIEDTSGYYWEWRLHIRMRPWLQPYIYYHFINLLKLFGIQDPFSWTLIIRLVSSIIGFASITYLFFTFKHIFFKTKNHFNYFIFFGFWFYPFLHSRTSAENLSITLFIFSFCILYKQLQLKQVKLNYFVFFTASFLMGLSMVTKFNLVFTTIPFFIWMTVFHFNIIRIPIYGISVILALSFGLFIDYINWGSYKNTYLQFYKFNLDETWGRLSDYGIEPWWYFFTETIAQLAPILSIFFVIGILIFWIKHPTNSITWITFVTVIFISMFSHKEIRYIFPVYIFAPFFISYFFEKFNYKYISNFLKIFIIISNLLFLSLTLFFPPNSKVGVYKYIYDNINLKNQIYYIENNPYLVNNMEPFIYTKFLPPINELSEEIDKKNIWIISNKFDQVKKLPNNCSIKYTTYPEFIFKLNENWKRLNLNWYILNCK